MRKVFHLLAGMIVWLVLAGHTALGAENLTVVTEDWHPYNYQAGDEVAGISTAVVKKVLERAGMDYTIDVYPWKRSYKMALEKENCLIYTIIRIEPREKLFKWVRPLGKGGVTSLYRLKRNTHIAPRNLDEAKAYRILANQDSMDHLWLKSKNFPHLETPPTVENAIMMFFKGRADLIAFDSSVMKEEFTKFGFSVDDVVPAMPLFQTPPYMAVSPSTSDAVLLKLQKAFDGLKAEGQIEPVN